MQLNGISPQTIQMASDSGRYTPGQIEYLNQTQRSFAPDDVRFHRVVIKDVWGAGNQNNDPNNKMNQTVAHPPEIPERSPY